MKKPEIKKLCKQLNDNEKSLRKLSIQAKVLTHDDITLLTQALAKNHSIVHLEVNHTDLSAKKLEKICNSLKNHTKIKGLTFNGCEFGNAGMAHLGKLLCDNSNITKLNLNNNGYVGDLGMTLLCEALAPRQEALEIDLGSLPEVTKRGVKSLCNHMNTHQYCVFQETSQFQRSDAFIKARIKNTCRNEAVDGLDKSDLAAKTKISLATRLSRALKPTRKRPTAQTRPQNHLPSIKI